MSNRPESKLLRISKGKNINYTNIPQGETLTGQYNMGDGHPAHTTPSHPELLNISGAPSGRWTPAREV